MGGSTGQGRGRLGKDGVRKAPAQRTEIVSLATERSWSWVSYLLNGKRKLSYHRRERQRSRTTKGLDENTVFFSSGETDRDRLLLSTGESLVGRSVGPSFTMTKGEGGVGRAGLRRKYLIVHPHPRFFRSSPFRTEYPIGKGFRPLPSEFRSLQKVIPSHDNRNVKKRA